MRLAACLAAIALAGCAGGDPPRLRPTADADRLSAAGSLAYGEGDYRAAVARFTAAIDAARALDDRAREARELHNRGLALLAAGAPDAAAADLTVAVRLSGDAAPADRAGSRLALAQADSALGRQPEALAECDRALGDARGDKALEARIRATAAAIAIAGGDPTAAAARLAGAGDGGDPAAAAALDHARGLVSLATGDRSAAEAAFARAIDGCRATGDLPGLAAALSASARCAESAGDLMEAARRWRRAAGVPAGGEARQRACLAAAQAADARR